MILIQTHLNQYSAHHSISSQHSTDMHSIPLYVSSSRQSWHRLGLHTWYMMHHYPLLVLHGISQWWRVCCIIIIFAWINFVWNVLVLLLKNKKTKKIPGGMAWSDDGKFVKIEQRPQDRPSLWHWIRSSINWCPSAISSFYRQKDDLLSKEVRVEFCWPNFVTGHFDLKCTKSI